jgi:hypothetical protein
MDPTFGFIAVPTPLQVSTQQLLYRMISTNEKGLALIFLRALVKALKSWGGGFLGHIGTSALPLALPMQRILRLSPSLSRRAVGGFRVRQQARLLKSQAG